MISLEWLHSMAPVEPPVVIHSEAEASTLRVETSVICLAIYLARSLAAVAAHREADLADSVREASMRGAEIWRQVSR